jgi:hypothetical protein
LPPKLLEQRRCPRDAARELLRRPGTSESDGATRWRFVSAHPPGASAGERLGALAGPRWATVSDPTVDAEPSRGR